MISLTISDCTLPLAVLLPIELGIPVELQS